MADVGWDISFSVSEYNHPFLSIVSLLDEIHDQSLYRIFFGILLLPLFPWCGANDYYKDLALNDEHKDTLWSMTRVTQRVSAQEDRGQLVSKRWAFLFWWSEFFDKGMRTTAIRWIQVGKYMDSRMPQARAQGLATGLLTIVTCSSKKLTNVVMQF